MTLYFQLLMFNENTCDFKKLIYFIELRVLLRKCCLLGSHFSYTNL